MKLDSKSGATLAAAAATLFLAGAAVSTVSTSANAANGQCFAANRCALLVGHRREALALASVQALAGVRGDVRQEVRIGWRQVRQVVELTQRGSALPGPACPESGRVRQLRSVIAMTGAKSASRMPALFHNWPATETA